MIWRDVNNRAENRRESLCASWGSSFDVCWSRDRRDQAREGRSERLNLSEMLRLARVLARGDGDGSPPLPRHGDSSHLPSTNSEQG